MENEERVVEDVEQFDLSGYKNICKFCKWNDNNGNCKENKDMNSVPNFGTDEAINYICESFDV